MDPTPFAAGAIVESPRFMHGAFSNLLAKRMTSTSVATADWEYWRQLSIVAMVLDNRILEQVHCFSNAGSRREYAVVRADEEQDCIRVLYTITAHSLEQAFYIMCADACDQEHYKDREEHDVVSRIDPEYRTLDVEALLNDVGSRAEWKVLGLWEAFLGFMHETYPWQIVRATTDHYKLSDFIRHN